MKKLLTLILALSLCIPFTSCIGEETGTIAKNHETEIFQLHNYPIWITTPDGWEECETTNFDLQCNSPKSDMYLSLFGFSKLDFAENQSVESYFKLQNDSLLSLRKNVSEIELSSSIEDDEKIVYSALYSGEYDGIKNYYHFSFVEFKSTGDMVWILFTGIPSVIEENREDIDSIISNVQNSDPRL